MERAKWMQWKDSSQLTKGELAAREVKQAGMANTAEEQGASLPAWPMLKHIAREGKLDTLVGPSMMEMHPLLKWGMHEWEEQDKPLVLLEWIDPTDRERTLACITGMEGRAMVVARPDKLMQADSDRLEAWGRYAVEETTNTNKEGWWLTGDKGVLKGG
eukprot:1714153-Rhodomonas_salina.2